MASIELFKVGSWAKSLSILKDVVRTEDLLCFLRLYTAWLGRNNLKVLRRVLFLFKGPISVCGRRSVPEESEELRETFFRDRPTSTSTFVTFFRDRPTSTNRNRTLERRRGAAGHGRVMICLKHVKRSARARARVTYSCCHLRQVLTSRHWDGSNAAVGGPASTESCEGCR